ncbi:MAG: alpha-ketoglutarate-dependent dioxygenase AlkB [Bacteroidia bacterium]|nr:alpha-ketoglutarate-dependent dioxygenase AlkB [Bacteroidia bacterium]
MPNPTQHQLLFDNNTSNLLPCNGHVNYFGKILSDEEILYYFNELNNTIAWKNDEVLIFGKLIITNRKVAWYATSNLDYTYSNISKKALPFTPALLSLKQTIEQKTGETYNACLLNLYQNGSEGMGWHSDDEKELEPLASIASLSLGADRKFSLKHKQNKQTVSVILENGSLLEMKNETQLFWKHALPKTTKVLGPRINLTFRKMVI